MLVRIALYCLLVVLLAGCSTRGLNDRFSSVTEQRLVTQSLDLLVKGLPEEDFEPLHGRQVALQAYFIEQPVYPEAHHDEQSSLLNFARHRLQLELQEKYSCRLVETAEQADFQLHFFFNAIGTDQDSLGFSTPELYLAGTGLAPINLIALEMFHGVTEGYYYIVDHSAEKTVRGVLQKARVRTDRLALPFISIPVNTLD